MRQLWSHDQPRHVGEGVRCQAGRKNDVVSAMPYDTEDTVRHPKSERHKVAGSHCGADGPPLQHKSEPCRKNTVEVR